MRNDEMNRYVGTPGGLGDTDALPGVRERMDVRPTVSRIAVGTPNGTC